MPTVRLGRLTLLPLTSLLVTLACAGGSSSPAVATPSDVDFGQVDVGGSTARSVTVTNTSAASVQIVDVTSSGVGVRASGRALPCALEPGKTLSLSLELAPTRTGDVSGSVYLVSATGTSSLAQRTGDVSGSPNLLSTAGTSSLTQIRTTGRAVAPNTALVPAPATLDLGQATVGQSVTKQATLTNTGGRTLHVTSVSVSAPGVAVSGLPLPATFAAGQSVTVSLTFAPTVAGVETGSVAFKSEQGRSLAVIEVDGTGVSPAVPVTLTATPAQLDFGSVTIGSFSAQGVTLTNGSSQSVTIAQVVAKGADFTTSGLAVPTTLAPGASATLSVKYTPAVVGTAAGQVMVLGSAGETLAVVGLAGSGVAAASITSVTVQDQAVVAGGSVQMVADVVAVGTIDKSLTWSVGTLGTIDPVTGVYTAPTTAGIYRVWATSNADPTIKGSGLVTVTDTNSGTVTPVTGIILGPPNGTDDTAAFNSAIDAANGGTVIVPGSGTYVVRAVAADRAATSISCSGTPAATIKLKVLASGDNSPIFNVTANTFTLKRCILDGQKSLQPGNQEGFNDSFSNGVNGGGRAYRSGIKMDGWYTGLVVDGATFKNMYGAPIAPRNVSNISVTNSTFQDNNFEAVYQYSTYVEGDPTHFLSGFTFAGNTVTNTRSHGTSVNANGMVLHQMSNIQVENNLIDGYERNGTKMENCRSAQFLNNTIRNGDFSNWSGIGMQNGGNYMTFSGNDISYAGTGIDSNLGTGYSFPPNTVDHVTVSGNTISNIKSGSIPDGIRIIGYGSATTNIAITGNTIRSVPRYGINVRQTTDYSSSPTFSGVTIQNNALTSAGSCGSWFTGTPVQPVNVTSSGNVCN